MRQRRLLWPAAGLLFLGCMSDRSSGCSVRMTGTDGGLFLGGCPPGPTVGTKHGVRKDGRVDVTAADAWPDRPPVEASPTALQVAEACAAFAACVEVSPQAQDGGAPPVEANLRSLALDDCLRGAPSLPAPMLFGTNTAERVILIDGAGESWDFFVSSVLAARDNCADVRAVLTKRATPTECQEDGCYQASDVLPTVTCQGDVATLASGTTHTERDCSRAGLHCSEQSPTGCNDRLLVACDSSAHDRCDGNVKLGCDGCGRVSFHDCSWNGGTCVETSDGNAHCQNPGNQSTCTANPFTCDGTKISRCVSGEATDVDCAALGMACKQGGTGPADAGIQCPAKGMCPGALCVQRAGSGADGG